MNPLELRESFRNCVRDYPKKTREKISLALQHLERDFGHPQRHRGLGLCKLTWNFFEIRLGLNICLIFQNRADCLMFLMAGTHDDLQKFLRGI